MVQHALRPRHGNVELIAADCRAITDKPDAPDVGWMRRRDRGGNDGDAASLDVQIRMFCSPDALLGSE